MFSIQSRFQWSWAYWRALRMLVGAVVSADYESIQSGPFPGPLPFLKFSFRNHTWTYRVCFSLDFEISKLRFSLEFRPILSYDFQFRHHGWYPSNHVIFSKNMEHYTLYNWGNRGYSLCKLTNICIVYTDSFTRMLPSAFLIHEW
jgi:hypothetical protein